uniref:TM protein n=1 Tax=Mus rat paramyxovirus TaxID=3141895 RepID=A0AAU7E3H9_9MONO
MSGEIYQEPDEPEPTYINMQRNPRVPCYTYTPNPGYGSQSAHYNGCVCSVKRGTVVILMLVIVLLAQAAAIAIGGVILYRLLPSGPLMEDQPSIPIQNTQVYLKSYLEQIKSQVNYVVSTITYTLPRELANSVRVEVERIQREVDKLEVLVLSSVLDLNMELNRNNSFTLSTGSKNGVCSQYLLALKKNQLEKPRACKDRSDRIKNNSVQLTTP